VPWLLTQKRRAARARSVPRDRRCASRRAIFRRVVRFRRRKKSAARTLTLRCCSLAAIADFTWQFTQRRIIRTRRGTDKGPFYTGGVVRRGCSNRSFALLLARPLLHRPSRANAAPPPLSSRFHRRARLTHGPHSAHVRENSRRIQRDVRSLALCISLSLSLSQPLLRLLPNFISRSVSGSEARTKTSRASAIAASGIAMFPQSSPSGSSMKRRVTDGRVSPRRIRASPSSSPPGVQARAISSGIHAGEIRSSVKLRAPARSLRIVARPRVPSESPYTARARARNSWSPCAASTQQLSFGWLSNLEPPPPVTAARPFPLGKFRRARRGGRGEAGKVRRARSKRMIHFSGCSRK